jgi:hypothetical protein
MAQIVSGLAALIVAGLSALAAALFAYHVVSKAQSMSPRVRLGEVCVAWFSASVAIAMAASYISSQHVPSGYYDLLWTVVAMSTCSASLALVGFFRALGFFQWLWPWRQ